MYQKYSNVNLLGKGSNRNELCLHKTNKFKDPLLFGCNCCKICIRLFLCIKDAALGGLRGFQILQRRFKSPPKSKGYLHKYDHVNFSHLRMDTTSINITIKANYGDPLTTIRSHCGILIIMRNGCEVCGKYLWTWCVAY